MSLRRQVALYHNGAPAPKFPAFAPRVSIEMVRKNGARAAFCEPPNERQPNIQQIG